MAQSLISFFVDDAAVTAMTTRVPDAVFNSGVFAGASNAPGIGISTENPELSESLPNWTLEDQFGNARAAQRSQCIGGPGISSPSESDGQEGTLPAATIRLVSNSQLPDAAEKEADSNVDGALAFPLLGANLTDLSTGWEEGA
ncbi:MAG: hypothetical protein GY703_24780 [Gammaproteobacteria bacterium]|nr:hypothetical protein [Gammaproteobacteria bacterium]MCP4466813.1 hypothetical protein [Halieaceae bacterium]